MKTSTKQFMIMVDYMEKNGDLNKVPDGPYGRIEQIRKWQDLVRALNADSSGCRKTTEKWKKVWSDFKNNTKKKARRLKEASLNGAVDCGSQFTELEIRVLNIIGVQFTAVQEKPKEESADVEFINIGIESQQLEPPPLIYITTDQTPQMFDIENMIIEAQEKFVNPEPPAPEERCFDAAPSASSSSSQSSVASQEHIAMTQRRKSIFSSNSRQNQKRASLNGTQTSRMDASHKNGSNRTPQMDRIRGSRMDYTVRDSRADPPTRSRMDSGARTSRERGARDSHRDKTTRKSRVDDEVRQFETSDERWRNLFSQITNEHLKLRDRELRMQERWQDLFEKCLSSVDKYLNK